MEGPKPNETAFRGVTLTVETESGSEEVRVRQLPLRDYERLSTVYLDEFQLVEAYTGRSRDWVLSLAPQSFTLIVNEGQRINADFFDWCVRNETAKISQVRRIAPEKIEQIIQGAVPSPKSSSMPVPHPGSARRM